MDNFERKLLKYWIQSFLLGVPKIIVGFRTRDGILARVQEYETHTIPTEVKRRGRATWDGDTCVNFASAFLECKSFSHSSSSSPTHPFAGLREIITDEGVWRIRRKPRSPEIEAFRVEEVGHGNIITDSFMNWRIKLSLSSSNLEGAQAQPEADPTPEA